MAFIKKTKYNKFGYVVGEIVMLILYCIDGNVKWYSHYGVEAP